jgi:hypothetical protein
MEKGYGNWGQTENDWFVEVIADALRSQLRGWPKIIFYSQLVGFALTI